MNPVWKILIPSLIDKIYGKTVNQNSFSLKFKTVCPLL